MSSLSKDSFIAMILVALCSLAVVVGALTADKNKTVVKQNEETKEAITKTITKSIAKDKVMVVPLEGVIYDSTTNRTPFKALYNAAYVKEKLLEALDDDKTKAVLLKMNSPGGTVATSQEIYSLVRELRKQNKPVVVSMSDVCASGCYYIASAADKIVANRGTLTGSIGVISQGFNYKNLLNRFGVYDQTFKSGKYKDIASGQRDMTTEEKQIMQNLLDNSYKQFLDDIEDSRKIERSKLEKIAQGLIYTGEQALEVSLIDVLGTYQDSKDVVKKLLTEYGYKDSSKIRFDESWSKTKLKNLGDILDLDLLGKTFSNYQALWLMP